MELRPRNITKAHLTSANIGEDYWVCDFANYMGPTSAKDVAKTYLKSLAELKQKGIGILFGGPPGPGKTTAAVIILKYLARAGWDVWMTSLGEVVENIQKSWNEKDEEAHAAFLEKCRTVTFLLIDDLGKEHAGPTGFSATVFDNLIRYRVQHRLPTFFTTNLTRNQIKHRYGDALLSLIEGKCQVVVVTGNDHRRTVLKKEVEERFNDSSS